MSSTPRATTAKVTRRGFLGRTAAAAALLTPTIVPSTVFGANAPNERINVGMIGLGNQSRADLPAFLEQPDTQVVAVCDVNTGSRGYNSPQHFLGRQPGLDRVSAYYCYKNNVSQYKGCDAYSDFREVLGRKDVDAVVIVVPDHWHALMTVMAAKAGKDIYCEKPLSLTIRQGQAMVDAVRQYKRVLQTGSMWRSSPKARHVCELVRNGRIGQVKRITTGVMTNNAKSPGPGWKPMPIPEGFDYDTWLGPSPPAPYHEDRCLYRFRFILEYSGGQTTNFGCHGNGIVQWALGTDGSGPVEFEDNGSEWPAPGDLFTTATKVDFLARYANGAELHCKTMPTLVPVRFEGTEGWIEFQPTKIESSPASLVTSTIGPNEIHLPVSVPSDPENLAQRPLVFGHARNFLDSIKTRTDPVEPVEAGHRTSSLCHLGNIAMRLHRKVRWDPEKQEVIGDDEAAAMLSRPMRAPWTL